MSDLERRYRRLLACYPRDHREHSGEEMLGVLMAGAGDRRRPGWRESVDLLWGAVRLHLRRVVAADGGIDHRDVLAIVSFLAPVAILAGATTGLHELGWWVRAGALWDMPWKEQVPDAPVWAGWLVVAVLGLFGLRRTAAVGAWLATAGFVLLAVVAPYQHGWTSLDAGLVLLGVMTAVALTWSPGPARGRELVGGSAIVVMAVAACGLRSRAGRRAALVLLLPAMTTLLGMAVLPATGRIPTAVEVAVFYGAPVLVLLTLGGLPRRIRRGTTGSVT